MGLGVVEEHQPFQASLRNSLLDTFVFPTTFFHGGFVRIVYATSRCPIRLYIRTPLLGCFHEVGMVGEVVSQFLDDCFFLRTQFAAMLSAATLEVLRFPCTILSRTSLNLESIG